MKNLCIIPARGGSKRIPKKNIKLFNGIPMIAWSIKCALEADIFKKVVVSSDDNEIISIARKYGATVPFRRPASLADDYTTTQEVIKHGISECIKNRTEYDSICCLYATSPFTSAKDLKKALDIVNLYSDAMVFPATTFEYPIQRAISINKNGWGEMLNKNQVSTRSQDLDESYHDAGQFYCASIERWLSNTPILEKSRPLIIPRWRVQDIDTEEDWKRAEIMAKMIYS